jgi:ribonuclease R
MRHAGRPLYLREIFHLSHLNVEERSEARAMVADLVQQGKLVLIKGDRYGLCDLMKLVTGRLTVHPDGFGFVRPDSGEGPDLFISASGLKGAVHNDRVVARVERMRGKRPEGSVLRILERGTRRIVGIFHRGRSVSVVVPEDERLFFEVIIPRKHTAHAKTGQVVAAEIDAYPSEGRNPEGRVVEILGDPDDLQVQTKIVIHKCELPHIFPPDVQEQAGALPKSVRSEDCRGRKDLRDLPLVTIDGENAKDFDDAVFVKKTRTGYVLDVAIADVSHYVPEGSPVDKTAVERGTSVYFPGAVVPMLPEALSNDLCSLVPGEDRLAVVARISFDRSGKVRKANFLKAIMRSHCRFTYKQVRGILADKDPELMERYARHVQHLAWMEELALALSQRRGRRGSIDFDLPEPEIILGLTGNLEEIVRRERNVAHQIIEEFMIAANEAVAEFLTAKAVPTLYRVHGNPDPQKLRDFVDFARSLGIHVELPEELGPWWCQDVLARVAGRTQQYVVNTVLLRTMQQAVYSPRNTGHFGLASSTYLHFTSPIRRYPDVIVHRVLKANLNRVRKRPLYSQERLADLGTHCSTRERTAMEAEREVLERLKVRFMADKIDHVYEGVISGVTSFGFFVELTDVFVEGAVRLVDLADDYYVLDQARHRLVGQRTHRVFQIGQTVMVRVKGVNIARRHINFEVITPQQREHTAAV